MLRLPTDGRAWDTAPPYVHIYTLLHRLGFLKVIHNCKLKDIFKKKFDLGLDRFVISGIP